VAVRTLAHRGHVLAAMQPDALQPGEAFRVSMFRPSLHMFSPADGCARESWPVAPQCAMATTSPWRSPARWHLVSCRALRLALLRTGLHAVSCFYAGACAHGQARAHPSALDRGRNLWVAAPLRMRAPSAARHDAVSPNWPSSRVCLPRIGPRPRGGTQTQRTPACGRAATGAVAAGRSSRRGSASRA
jgi:hypothetical protein